MKPKILVADSEEMFAEAVAYVLEQAGFEAVVAHDSRVALEKAREAQPDLCILSAALLPVSCFQLCCDLRRDEAGGLRAPILMLGNDPHEETRVAVLDCGVDDYLVKPFGMKEFMARVYALLRRAKVPLEALQNGEVRAGKFLLNIVQNLLTVQEESGPRAVSMTPKEAQVLHLLMSNMGSVVSRETLVERVWGQTEAQPGLFNALDVHMRAVRKKVEVDADDPQHILVVRGVGFRFQP